MTHTSPVINLGSLRAALYAGLAFVVLYGLGIWGFLQHGFSWPQAFYSTLKLVLVDAPEQLFDYANWALLFSAFTLPLFPAAALLGLLGAAAGVQWRLLRIVVNPRKHVFLGAGKMASSVLHALHERGERSLLAIDEDTESLHSQKVAQMGALLFRHDANNTLLLCKLRLHCADTIYVFLGDDARNLEVAQKIVKLMQQVANPPRLVVNIESRDMLMLATEAENFRAYQRRGELLWLSAPEYRARELSKRFPLRTQSSLTAPGPLHVAVVGQCANAHALILQFAKQNALLTEAALHISVFGQSPTTYETFMRDHPVLNATADEPEFGGVAPLVQLQFVNIGADGVSPRALREAINKQANLPVSAAYIVEPNDYRGLTATVRMCQVAAAQNLATRVICCLAGTDFTSAAQAQQATLHYGAALQRVAWFHSVGDVFVSHEHYPGERSDIFGLLVHTAYRAIYSDPPLTSETDKLQSAFEQRFATIEHAAQTEWLAELPEAFRASSRHSGDHMFIKLRELGFELRPRKADSEEVISEAAISALNDAITEHLPRLLRLEHTRFCTERLVDGWLYHDSNDKPLRLNKTLVPFAELPPNEVFKDEVIIRVMPVLLRHPYVQKHFVLQQVS